MTIAHKLAEHCSHRTVIKRPESGPGSRKPGEWVCLDCDTWWKAWRPFFTDPEPPPDAQVGNRQTTQEQR